MVREFRRLDEYLILLEASGLIKEHNLGQNKAESIIKYISYDSRDVGRDTLFVCKSSNFKKEYLLDAIDSGATCYISEKKYDINDEKISYIIVDDIRKAMAYVANCYYASVWNKLEMIGITGTKGKTSTAFFVRNIIDSFAKSIKIENTGFVSTVTVYDGKEEKDSNLTTPETFELHRILDNAVRNNLKYFAMEVSSQALKYHRTLGICFNVGCFLNIGEDHISELEHKDLDDYFNSKLLLLNQSEMVCVNIDSNKRDEIIKHTAKCRRLICFGTDKNFCLVDNRESSDYLYAYDIKNHKGNYCFKVRSDSFDEEFEIGLMGDFNISNALASIAIAYSLNIPVENIKKGLKKTVVPGRMEKIYNKKKNTDIIIDYAHNQMSFEALMKTVKKTYPEKKLSVVFGATGDKGIERRTHLGKLANQYADYVYITQDDPGKENLRKICEQIADNIDNKEVHVQIIEERKEAIKKAIQDLDKNKVLVVTGRGVQKYMKIGDEYKKYPTDRELIEKFM